MFSLQLRRVIFWVLIISVLVGTGLIFVLIALAILSLPIFFFLAL